jgi:hypothetical protein
MGHTLPPLLILLIPSKSKGEFRGQYTEFDYLIGDWLSDFQFQLQNS